MQEEQRSDVKANQSDEETQEVQQAEKEQTKYLNKR